MKNIVIVITLLFVISVATFGIISLPNGSGALPNKKEDTQIVRRPKVEANRPSVESIVRKKEARPTTATNRPVQTEIVMEELLFNYKFIRDRAEKVSQLGKNPTGLVNYYKRKLKLTDIESRAFDDVLVTTIVEIRPFDDEIIRLTENYRNQTKNGVEPGRIPRPIYDELRVFDEQRKNLLNQMPSKLRASMGDSGYEKLDSFITKELMPRIRVTSLQNHEMPNPRIRVDQK